MFLNLIMQEMNKIHIFKHYMIHHFGCYIPCLELYYYFELKHNHFYIQVLQ